MSGSIVRAPRRAVELKWVCKNNIHIKPNFSLGSLGCMDVKLSWSCYNTILMVKLYQFQLDETTQNKPKTTQTK